MSKLSLKKVAPGHKFLGCIKQVRDFDLMISLPNRLFGTVPCNLISTFITTMFSTFAASKEQDIVPSLTQFYKAGEFVICVVKRVETDDNNKKRIELSMLPADVNSMPVTELTEGLLLCGSIESKEDRGLLVDVGISSAFCKQKETADDIPVGKTRIFTCISTKSKVLQVSTIFGKSGLASDSIVSQRALLPGNLIDASISAVQGTRLMLSLPGGLIGYLDYISLDHNNTNVELLKPKDKILARLVSLNEDGSEALLSARPTVMKLESSGLTSSHIGASSKVAVTCIDRTQGILFSSAQGDCFIQTSKLSEDQKLDDFKKGASFTGRIIGFDPFDSLFLVSFDPSVLKAPFIGYSDIQPGTVVKGEIIKVDDYGLLIRLTDNTKAICPLFHMSDQPSMSKSILSKYKVGQKMSFRILEVDSDARKVTVCRRRNMNNMLKCLEDAKVGMSIDGYVVNVKQVGAVVRFCGSLTAFLPVSELCDNQFVESAENVLRVGQTVSVKVKEVDLDKKRLIVSMRNEPRPVVPSKRPRNTQTAKTEIENAVPVDENIKVAHKVENETKPLDDIQDTHAKPKRLKDLFEQLSSDDQQELEGSTMEISKPSEAIKKTRPNKNITDGFEKRLLSTPNASAVWIEYAAALIVVGNIIAARNILERALQTISIRQQDEKLNIWTSLLNLENIYGTPSSMRSLFERALQHTEPKHLYLRMVDIYIQSGKQAEAGEIFEEMLKKFKSSCKVWIACMTFHMTKSRNLSHAHSLLTTSLKSLPSRKHVKCMLKCIQLEYKHGEVERGRTLFEGLLAAHPKRIDLWLIYIQMEENLVKDDDLQVERVRRLYERSLTLKLSSKKAKTFFKGYLAFEKKCGGSTGVERVKQLAREFVESKSQQ